MTKRIALIAFAAAATIFSGQAAFAHDVSDRIEDGREHIAGDRAALNRDQLQLRQELSELREARQHRTWARWHGWSWRAHHAQHQVAHERSEIYALEHKITRERTGIRHDTAVVHRYAQHRRNHYWAYERPTFSNARRLSTKAGAAYFQASQR